MHSESVQCSSHEYCTTSLQLSVAHSIVAVLDRSRASLQDAGIAAKLLGISVIDKCVDYIRVCGCQDRACPVATCMRLAAY